MKFRLLIAILMFVSLAFAKDAKVYNQTVPLGCGYALGHPRTPRVKLKRMLCYRPPAAGCPAPSSYAASTQTLLPARLCGHVGILPVLCCFNA